MAAAAIPILSAIIPVILPGVISLVERALGRKGGDKKLEVARTILDAIFRGIEQRNPGNSLPNVSEITDMIQQAVDKMNQVGSLKGHETDVSLASTTMSVEVRSGALKMLEGALLLMKATV